MDGTTSATTLYKFTKGNGYVLTSKSISKCTYRAHYMILTDPSEEHMHHRLDNDEPDQASKFDIFRTISGLPK